LFWGRKDGKLHKDAFQDTKRQPEGIEKHLVEREEWKFTKYFLLSNGISEGGGRKKGVRSQGMTRGLGEKGCK